MRQAPAPSSNSVTASSAGSAPSSTAEIACATPRSVVRTESLVLVISMASAVRASRRADGIAFELHALGAHRFGQLVEEGVPLAIDVCRGVLRRHRLEPAIRLLDDKAIGDETLQRAGDVEIDADAEAGGEVLLDCRIDIGNILPPCALLREYAVEQHFFLDVFLGGPSSQLQHDAAVVGHGVEVEVLRHHHHVPLLLVHKVDGRAEGDTAEADKGAGGGDGVGGKQRDLPGSTKGAEPQSAARRCAQTQLVEEAELHARIRKHHLEIASRDVLEQLHVDAVFFYCRGYALAFALDDLLSFAAAELLRLHHLAHALVERFQLEE